MCFKCPAFTTSRRHAKDADNFIEVNEDGESVLDLDHFATSCELESEFHVKETGQIYKAQHFSARKLCSAESNRVKSHLCAGEGIIGPISDIEFVSKIPADIRDIVESLNEDEGWDDEEFNPLYKNILMQNSEDDDEDSEFRRQLHSERKLD